MLNIPVKSLINISYKEIDMIYSNYLSNNMDVLNRISKIENISCIEDDIEQSAQILVDNATFHVSLKGIIDIEKELNRLNRDLSKLQNDISIINSKLTNKNFTSRAPSQVIEEQTKRKELIENRILRIQTAVTKLK